MWWLFLVHWNILFKSLWWNLNVMILRDFTFNFPIPTKAFELFGFVYWSIVIHVFLQRNIEFLLMNFIIFLFEITLFILMGIIDDTWLWGKMLHFRVTFHGWLLKFLSWLGKILSFSDWSVTYNLLRLTFLPVRDPAILSRFLNLMISIIQRMVVLLFFIWLV